MKKAMAAIIAGFLVIFQGCIMTGNIVSDAKQVRASNKKADIDISEIVQKYIPVGSKKETVDSYLMANKFSLYYQPKEKLDHDLRVNKSYVTDTLQVLFATYKPPLTSSGWYTNPFFYDVIRVVVVFEDDTAREVTGKIIIRSL